MKINKFWGDLIDISAEKVALQPNSLAYKRLQSEFHLLYPPSEPAVNQLHILAHPRISAVSPQGDSGTVLPFSKLNEIFIECFDPEKIFLCDENN